MGVTTAEIAATRQARLEDATWLADTGESLSGAAQRMGLQRDALIAFLWRHDRATYQRLLNREPRDHNARKEPRSAA